MLLQYTMSVLLYTSTETPFIAELKIIWETKLGMFKADKNNRC